MAAMLDSVSSKVYGALENRADTQEQLKQFAINRPKLAAYLAVQSILTGIPLILFLAFAVTVTAVSLVVALLFGVLAAVTFTGFVVGGTLLVVIPFLFFTTFVASFLFLWGLSNYAIRQWFVGDGTRTDTRRALTDKINALTGNGQSKPLKLGDCFKANFGVSGFDHELNIDSNTQPGGSAVDLALNFDGAGEEREGLKDGKQEQNDAHQDTAAKPATTPSGPVMSADTNVVENIESPSHQHDAENIQRPSYQHVAEDIERPSHQHTAAKVATSPSSSTKSAKTAVEKVKGSWPERHQKELEASRITFAEGWNDGKPLDDDFHVGLKKYWTVEGDGEEEWLPATPGGGFPEALLESPNKC